MNKKIEDKFFSKLADSIIKSIMANKAIWQRDWSASELALPFNCFSKTEYNGINVLPLCLESSMCFGGDPRWVTFNQVKQLGGKVNKGEKSSTVLFYKTVIKETEDDDGNVIIDEDKKEVYFIAKTFDVFNVQQCSFPDESELSKPYSTGTKQIANFKENDLAEKIIKSTKATINYGGDKAFYSPKSDSICIPDRNTFNTESAFYGTVFHELGHWTGHKTRLDRLDLLDLKNPNAYAREELVAELTSFLLCSDIGIGYQSEANSIAYLDGWSKKIVGRKDDNNYMNKLTDEIKLALRQSRAARNFINKLNS